MIKNLQVCIVFLMLAQVQEWMKRALQAESGQGIGGISAEDAQNLVRFSSLFRPFKQEEMEKKLALKERRKNGQQSSCTSLQAVKMKWRFLGLFFFNLTTLNKERQNWKDKIEELELQMAMAEKALVVEYNTKVTFIFHKYSTMKQQIEAEIRDSRDTTVDMTELGIWNKCN